MTGAQKGMHYLVDITGCCFGWQQELLLAGRVSQSMLPLLTTQFLVRSSQKKICTLERNVVKPTVCHSASIAL